MPGAKEDHAEAYTLALATTVLRRIGVQPLFRRPFGAQIAGATTDFPIGSAPLVTLDQTLNSVAASGGSFFVMLSVSTLNGTDVLK